MYHKIIIPLNECLRSQIIIAIAITKRNNGEEIQELDYTVSKCLFSSRQLMYKPAKLKHNYTCNKSNVGEQECYIESYVKKV